MKLKPVCVWSAAFKPLHLAFDEQLQSISAVYLLSTINHPLPLDD